MSFHLVCVHPFHGYERGQIVTDPHEIARLSVDREGHFVRTPVPRTVEGPVEAEIMDKHGDEIA